MTSAKKTVRPRKKGWYYRMSLSSKRGLWGLVFLSPWLFGFLAFFLRPFWDTVKFAFSTVEISLGAADTTFIGFENFRWALTVDPVFNQLILTLVFALGMVAVVIIFSLLAAMLINGKYPGRSVVRTIFFIPIIMGGSIAIASIVGEDQVTMALGMGLGGFGGFTGGFFLQTLQATGLPVELTGFVNNAINQIFTVLSQAGVPVLIFLAGLQSIPTSLYEVATIEGSTSYESFWKVTLPMISPMILLSTVYTIIDLFMRHRAFVDGTEHALFQTLGRTALLSGRINTIAFTQNNFGLASAMVLIYMIVCLLIIAIISKLISRVVFYYD